MRDTKSTKVGKYLLEENECLKKEIDFLKKIQSIQKLEIKEKDSQIEFWQKKYEKCKKSKFQSLFRPTQPIFDLPNNLERDKIDHEENQEVARGENFLQIIEEESFGGLKVGSFRGFNEESFEDSEEEKIEEESFGDSEEVKTEKKLLIKTNLEAKTNKKPIELKKLNLMQKGSSSSDTYNEFVTDSSSSEAKEEGKGPKLKKKLTN